jgi:hypothetical protein
MGIVTIGRGAGLPSLDTLFEGYAREQLRQDPSALDPTIIDEVSDRLKRMRWVEWRVRELDIQICKPGPAGPPLLMALKADLKLEISTLVEAWYYLSFRTMRLLKKHCPGIESFEILGITLTRNKLMEHDNDVFSGNLSIGDPEGPKIKGPRWDGQSKEWADPGMYTNAAAFDEKLRSLLMRRSAPKGATL